MRWSITDLFAGSPEASANHPGSPSLHPEIEALLVPFQEQSAAIRSIVAVGCRQMFGLRRKDPVAGIFEEAFLLRPVAEVENTVTGEPARPAGLESLARRARELLAPDSAFDLLLVSADLLHEILLPPAVDLSFRAVAVVFSQTSGQPGDEESWTLQSDLFDRGLICIGSVPATVGKALCFLASDAIRSFKPLDVESRGLVSMSVLVQGAGFANQLFRYSCAKLYALRHGLTAAFPPWQGNELFGLEDKSSIGLDLPTMTFKGFAHDDCAFWDTDNPPINMDLVGYFQELPECWRRHRPLLRRLFQLSPELSQTLDVWRQNVTDGGRRTLVAVHVRRGDYRNF